MNKKCFGLKISEKGCSILSGCQDCDGYNEDCSFYKTAEQAVVDEDNAIKICRSKGLCASCKYMLTSKGNVAKPCSLSTEGKRWN